MVQMEQCVRWILELYGKEDESHPSSCRIISPEYQARKYSVIWMRQTRKTKNRMKHLGSVWNHCPKVGLTIRRKRWFKLVQSREYKFDVIMKKLLFGCVHSNRFASIDCSRRVNVLPEISGVLFPEITVWTSAQHQATPTSRSESTGNRNNFVKMWFSWFDSKNNDRTT